MAQSKLIRSVRPSIKFSILKNSEIDIFMNNVNIVVKVQKQVHELIEKVVFIIFQI
jgi:hypothetical protein